MHTRMSPGRRMLTIVVGTVPQRLGSGVDLQNRIAPSQINIILLHYNSENSVEIKRYSSRTWVTAAEFSTPPLEENSSSTTVYHLSRHSN